MFPNFILKPLHTRAVLDDCLEWTVSIRSLDINESINHGCREGVSAFRCNYRRQVDEAHRSAP